MKKFSPDFLIKPRIIIQDKNLKRIDGDVYGACYWFEQLKDGICKASNKSIAEVVCSSNSTVADSLTRLEKCGYIKRNFKDKEKKHRSKIECLVKYSVAESEESKKLDTENEDTLDTETEEQSNNIKEVIDNTNVLSIELPISLGKTYILRLAKIYSILWKDFYGFDYNYDFATLGRILKPLIARYTEYQIASFMIQHFNWYGATGEDQFSYDKIMKAGFQLTWIPNSANIYEAYLRNSLGIKFDDPEEVKTYVDEFIKSLIK